VLLGDLTGFVDLLPAMRYDPAEGGAVLGGRHPRRNRGAHSTPTPAGLGGLPPARLIGPCIRIESILQASYSL